MLAACFSCRLNTGYPNMRRLQAFRLVSLHLQQALRTEIAWESLMACRVTRRDVHWRVMSTSESTGGRDGPPQQFDRC